MAILKPVAILALALLSAAATPARAAAICSSDSSADTEARLRYLRSTLQRTIVEDRSWAKAWAIGWGGLTAVQLAVAPFVATADNNRNELYVGAGGSALGLIPTLLVRPRSLHYEDVASSRVVSCTALKTAEDALSDTADEERLRRGWGSRVAGALVSTGLALFLALDFHHWASAGATFGFGLIASELMIQTSTDLAVRNSERYARGELQGDTARPRAFRAPSLVVLLDHDHAGLGVTLGF